MASKSAPASTPARAKYLARFVPILFGRRRAGVVLLAVAILLAAVPAHAQTGNSSAFGVQAIGTVTALNAAILATLALGPVPTASGSAPPAYNVSNSAVSATGNLALVSPIALT